MILDTVQAKNKLRQSPEDWWQKIPQAGHRINVARILQLFKKEANLQWHVVFNIILNIVQVKKNWAEALKIDPEHTPSSKTSWEGALNLDDYESHQADHRINLQRILQLFKDKKV